MDPKRFWTQRQRVELENILNWTTVNWNGRLRLNKSLHPRKDNIPTSSLFPSFSYPKSGKHLFNPLKENWKIPPLTEMGCREKTYRYRHLEIHPWNGGICSKNLLMKTPINKTAHTPRPTNVCICVCVHVHVHTLLVLQLNGLPKITNFWKKASDMKDKEQIITPSVLSVIKIPCVSQSNKDFERTLLEIVRIWFSIFSILYFD